MMDKIREARLNLKRAKFAFYLSVVALCLAGAAFVIEFCLLWGQ